MDVSEQRWRVEQTLFYVRQSLQEVSTAPAFEAKQLVSHVLRQSVNWLYLNPDYELTAEEMTQLNTLTQRRASGYPLAYLLGRWGFYHWDFYVNEHVLIPRPETELLVEQAMTWANNQFPSTTPLRIVDVGTGSGIIGISLALLLPNASVLAVDISEPALEVARRNAQALGASNISFTQSDLLSTVPPQQFDIIAANLPYVDPAELPTLEVARYEPHIALAGGTHATALIEALLQQSLPYLANPAAIFLEIGHNQEVFVAEYARQLVNSSAVTILSDLNEYPRLVKIIVST
jgi:release factor glutamine methyltransferase